ncbi:MAG TPA: hypothetical protein VLI72_01850 [Methylibium sp.]|nr:hypothetical protein [Methylibium sp.]
MSAAVAAVAPALAALGPGRLICLHVGPRLTPWLERFLGRPVHYAPRLPARDVAAVVGWGLKGVSREAHAAARRAGLPYIALEDGFLRSLGLGDTDAALSLVVDDLGIYYDASAPSRLEALIARAPDAARRARGAALAARWCAGRVSKYNHAPEAPSPVVGPYVLVVDQTAGDASIVHGLAEATSFARMLEAALDEHPRLPVILKVHPDVVAGRRQGHFGRLGPAQAARVTLLAADAHPPALLEQATSVYTVTSQMGFEALLWGKPVRCFGLPFYAGWGLTGDALPAPPRRAAVRGVTVADLAHAALIDYPRCLDPLTQRPGEPEALLDWLAAQRRLPPGQRSSAPAPGADEPLRWRALRALKRARDRWRR